MPEVRLCGLWAGPSIWRALNTSGGISRGGLKVIKVSLCSNKLGRQDF